MQETKWLRISLRYAAPLVWMAVISLGSTTLFSPERPGSLLLMSLIRWLLPEAGPATAALVYGVLRKGIHVAEFAALAWLWYWALPKRRAAGQVSGALAALGLAMGFAIMDELHQAFVPGRTATPVDVGWDSLGAALALATAWVGSRK